MLDRKRRRRPCTQHPVDSSDEPRGGVVRARRRRRLKPESGETANDLHSFLLVFSPTIITTSPSPRPPTMASAPHHLARLSPTRTALFLCDIQSRFATAIHQWPSVVSTSAKMLRAASILSLPVYATEQAPKALGSTVSPLAELLEQCPAPTTKKAVAKTRFSMVLPPGGEGEGQHDGTDEWLREAGSPTSVIIVGIESHVCVLQTTLDLLERGLQVHVLADGVSSCNAGERRWALEVSSTARSAAWEMMFKR